MRYIMKSGFLSEEGKILAEIKIPFSGNLKTVFLPDNGKSYEISVSDPSGMGDVRYKSYALTGSDAKVIVEGRPGYASEDDLDTIGWPAYRLPKTDHADIKIGSEKYVLTMHNSLNYSMKNSQGNTVLQVMHTEISGGWTIDAPDNFSPEIITGLFIFCRYIEQENEFIVG